MPPLSDARQTRMSARLGREVWQTEDGLLSAGLGLFVVEGDVAGGGIVEAFEGVVAQVQVFADLGVEVGDVCGGFGIGGEDFELVVDCEAARKRFGFVVVEAYWFCRVVVVVGFKGFQLFVVVRAVEFTAGGGFAVVGEGFEFVIVSSGGGGASGRRGGGGSATGVGLHFVFGGGAGHFADESDGGGLGRGARAPGRLPGAGAGVGGGGWTGGGFRA